ncbi:hypothetical protein M3Y97_00731500 [Aphelenchoides bicaudatus]|nr:hypothetical protein M3Y97_00731500 [Aphelenchoides bicaudatus]
MSEFVVEYSETNLARVAEIYDKNGFVLVENVFMEQETEEMKREMDKIVDSLDLESHPKSIFSTEDQNKHASDKFFLDSAGKISHFYEEGALNKEGELIVAKDKALNKVGHALHWLNSVYKKYSFHEKIKNLIKAVDYKYPKIVQSMYIFKQPKIGGSVTDHIDASFLRSEIPGAVVGVWIALDEATQENGCLWFTPESHKTSDPNAYMFVRTNSEDPKDPLVKFLGEQPKYDQSKFVPVPVKKGSLVLIHCHVVHKSEPNTSDKSRHAYTFHVADGNADWKWDKNNWLQESEDYSFPSLYDS